MIEHTNRQIRTIENLKSDVKRMIKYAAKKKGLDEVFPSSDESCNEGRISLGSQPAMKHHSEQEILISKGVCTDKSNNFKHPAEIQMTGAKRKRMEISDLDSQKGSTGKENAKQVETEKAEEPIEKTDSTAKKRITK